MFLEILYSVRLSREPSLLAWLAPAPLEADAAMADVDEDEDDEGAPPAAGAVLLTGSMMRLLELHTNTGYRLGTWRKMEIMCTRWAT